MVHWPNTGHAKNTMTSNQFLLSNSESYWVGGGQLKVTIKGNGHSFVIIRALQHNAVHGWYAGGHGFGYMDVQYCMSDTYTFGYNW